MSSFGFHATRKASVSSSGKGIQQIVVTSTGLFAQGTGIIPSDNTIPQINEGQEFMSRVITPSNALSTLIIEASAFLANSLAGGHDLTAALFRDQIADALVAGIHYGNNQQELSPIILRHVMIAATVLPITFRLRAGSNQASTTRFNGKLGQQLGGVMNSHLMVTEVLP